MARIVEVRCHSGYRGEEYPLSLVCEKEECGIVEILEQAVVEDGETGQRMRMFIVKTDRDSQHRLIHLEDADVWYCSTQTRDRSPMKSEEAASRPLGALDGPLNRWPSVSICRSLLEGGDENRGAGRVGSDRKDQEGTPGEGQEGSIGSR